MDKTKRHSPKRDCVIDVVKCICITNVVIFHSVGMTVLPDFLKIILPAYTLQVFFMMSGWLDYGRDVESWKDVTRTVGRKFKGLIIPYISFSILTIIWHIIICVGFKNPVVSHMYTGWKVILRDVFCMFSGIGVGTLWFLPPLFFSYAVMQIVRFVAFRKTKHGNIVVLLVCAFLLAASFFLRIGVNNINNGMFMTESMLLKVLFEYVEFTYRVAFGSMYALLGYLFRKDWEKVKRYRIPMLCVTIPLAVLTYFTMSQTVIFDLFLSLSVFLFVMGLPKPGEKVTKLLSPLTFLGINSLSIMILHYNFLYPVEKLYFDDWILFFVNYSTTVLLMIVLLKTRWYNLALGKKPK